MFKMLNLKQLLFYQKYIITITWMKKINCPKYILVTNNHAFYSTLYTLQ